MSDPNGEENHVDNSALPTPVDSADCISHRDLQSRLRAALIARNMRALELAVANTEVSVVKALIRNTNRSLTAPTSHEETIRKESRSMYQQRAYVHPEPGLQLYVS